VSDYLRNRLLEPVGMRSAMVEFDAAGTLIGSSMMYATARDWAKFGEFLRNGGAVRGASSDHHDLLFPDRAAQGIFACIGHLGQYVIVSPSQKLTVVRMGRTQDPTRAHLRDHLAKIIALFPQD
jgi:CubicO group peptidase (beta-lactamase class C family)